MLKLLFIRVTFPKFSETFFINELLESIQIGHDVRILALNGESDILHKSYLTSSLSQKVIYAEDKTSFESALSKANYKPDIVISPFGTNLSVKRTSKISTLYNIPYIVILRARDIFTDLSYGKLTLPDLCPTKLKSSQETLSIISKANGVSTISEENIQYLKNEFKIPHDIHLYRLGIDIEKFFFKPINNSSQSKRLLYIGRFIEKKGIEYLLQSMANLKDHEIKFELHLFGEGPLKDRFDFLIVELSLEKHVFIHAKISQEDVVKEFHRSDLFIVPSIVDENNDRDVEATVIKEAMACGIPVITTDIPGNHSFIQHNVNGYIVAQKDSEALGAAIVHLSKSGIAESLVLKAREHMCKFYDLKKSCSLLNEFFEKVVRDFREDN